MVVTSLRCGCPPETADSVRADWLCCEHAAPDGEAIARLVIDALGEPLGLPPLAQCLTPDDRIAIAVGHGTPSAGPLVAGVVASLAAAGINRSHIHVVAAASRDAVALESALEHEALSGVLIESHDPSDSENLCFAGLAKGDRSLMVNRTIFDADVVLPISAENATSDAAGGAYDGLFPDFFDTETIARFRKVRTVNDATVGGGGRLASRRAEAEEAGWLVGAPLVLRAVPGPGGGLTTVVAGDPKQVDIEAARASREAWQASLAEPADAVLAIISGGSDQQTWESIGRALATADQLARPGGVLAIWSELQEPIGEKLARLADAEDLDRIEAELAAESGEQALAACRVLRAIERGPVFLHSQLDSEVIEPLGIAPVASTEEMLRMLSRFGSCTVLEEAQHVRFSEASDA